MAPGTNIGAASPVGSGGEDITGTIGAKVRNDAIANIKSIAETRGRDVDWAVSTVDKAVSSSALEAVAVGAVDGIATSLEDVRRKADGQVVTVGAVPVTVDIADAPFVELSMNPFQSILHLLSDPNIAFILLTIGFYGLIFELQSPNFVTGILGAIALILAFIGFGSLPLNVAGLLLIGLAIVLFALEFTVTSHGLLFVGGLICFVLGAFALYTAPGNPTAPDVAVATPLILFMAALTTGFMLLVLVTIVRARRRGLAYAGAYGAGGIDVGAARQRRVRQAGAHAARHRLHGRRGVVGTVEHGRRDPQWRTGPRRRPGRAYAHRRTRRSHRINGTAGDHVTSDQILPSAIVAVIVILVIVGVVRAAQRRRGANEDAFGAGGVPDVAVGTRGVAKTDLAPSGVVRVVSEEWTARSANDTLIAEGTAVRVVRHDGLTLIVEPEPGVAPEEG